MKLSAKEYAKSLIGRLGKNDAKEELSKAICELSKNGYAFDNKHQIRFFTNALFNIEKL